MWSLIRWLVLRFAALRWVFKLFGLGLFLPIAFLLKMIGLPLLGVMAIIGLPILFLLFLFGLPVILVLAFGSLFIGLVSVVLTIGVAALKIFIFFVLPIWLMVTVVRKVWSWVTRKRGPDTGDSTPPSTSTPPSSPTEPATGPINSASEMPPGGEPA